MPLQKSVYDGMAEVRLRRRNDGKERVKKKVTVDLKDCLACSGCITSAETVLLKVNLTEN